MRTIDARLSTPTPAQYTVLQRTSLGVRVSGFDFGASIDACQRRGWVARHNKNRNGSYLTITAAGSVAMERAHGVVRRQLERIRKAGAR